MACRETAVNRPAGRSAGLTRGMCVRAGFAALTALAGYALFLPKGVIVCAVLAPFGAGPVGAAAMSCAAWAAVAALGAGVATGGVGFCLVLLGTWTVFWSIPGLRRHMRLAEPEGRLREIVSWIYPMAGAALLALGICIRSELSGLWACSGALLLAVGMGQDGAWASCARRVPRVRRLLLHGAAIAVISLVLVEAGVRTLSAFGGAERVFGWPARGPLVVAHPRRWYTPRPGFSCDMPFQTDKDTRSTFPYRLSKQGLRGPDYGVKRANEWRIAVLGDSFAMGWGLKEPETIERVLEEALRGRCPGMDVTVINAGVSGYSVWQERDLLREVVMPLEPDLVVHLVFPTNDLDGYWERRKTFPRTHAPGWRKILEPYMQRDDWRFRMEDAVAAHWQTLELVRRRYPERFGQPVVDLLDRLRFIPARAVRRLPQSDHRPVGVTLNKAKLDPDESEAFAEMCADVAGTRGDCLERGVKHIAAVLPSCVHFYEDQWIKATAGHAADGYEKGREVSVTEACLASAGVETVDLYGPLMRAHRDGETYWRYDEHLNPRGARIVAETLLAPVISKFPDGQCTIGAEAEREPATDDKER